MRIATVGLAALLTGAFGGGAFAQGSETLGDEIQQEEDPGSEIEAEIGGGGMIIGRERNMPPAGAEVLPVRPVAPSPVIIGGEAPSALPDDPDQPVSPDAIDAELPGEGPEDLSGPDDDDPLPE
jgi:hypothetical protein